MAAAVPGQRSRDLITELRRAAANGPLFITRYNEDRVRQVLNESSELYSEITDLMDGKPVEKLPPPVKTACIVHHATIKRNKRCALTYVEQRASTIKRLRWELGPLLPEETRTNMSHREQKFLAEYDQLVTGYTKDTGVDVTSDLTPPKELHVQVRVLKDCGEIMTETGAITLALGTTHSLRRRDVELLVRQGYLEEHSHLESC